MVNTGEATTLIYPHEGLEVMRENMHGVQGTVYELSHFAGYLSLQTLHIESLSARSRAYAVANGGVGADIFPNKQRFSDMVNELGYHAPRSVRITPEDMADGVDYYDQVVALDNQEQRFCKPANATRGRGARMLETPEAALAFVAEQEEPYLVQTFEKPDRDWRYIRHRDSTQLASDEQSGWHVMFKVARPTVVGSDGKSIAELVMEEEGIPEGAKQSYIKTHKDVLATVPAAGELVQLVQTGNRAQGAYREPHIVAEEVNLDRFMTQFIHDVESELGTTLGTLCVDLGVKDSSVLLGEYDFDRIRDDIVFYEHQLPFGMKPYLHEMIPPETRWSPTDRLVPESRRRQYIEGQIYTSFVRSVIRSGKFLRDHSI